VRSRLVLGFGLLALLGCTQEYVTNFKDISMEPPFDIELQLKRFRSGEEKWRGDPKAVADMALREKVPLRSAPWEASPFHAPAYEVKFKPEWGTFVTRGYPWPNGGMMRYRVKLRNYFEIWYPVEISHQLVRTMPHPALDEDISEPR